MVTFERSKEKFKFIIVFLKMSWWLHPFSLKLPKIVHNVKLRGLLGYKIKMIKKMLAIYKYILFSWLSNTIIWSFGSVDKIIES